MDGIVKTERQGAVLEIIMNRGDRLNAFNLQLFEGLVQALREAEDPAIRAVILRGEGKAFSVGGDIRIFAELAASGRIVPESVPDLLHDAMTRIRQLGKPVLAVVNGACAGAGLSMALACDLVVAASDAKFNLAYTGIGLSPDGGSTYFLPRHVGLKRATEIFLTGKTMTAAEALELGLINRVESADQVLEQGRMLAQMLAAGPTAAFARLKKLLNATFDNDLAAHLKMEARLFSESSATADFQAGVKAFLEKRAPEFVGR